MTHLQTVRSVILLAGSSFAAGAILNHFANRRRGRKVETVSRLVQVCGSGTARTAVIAALRQLESCGFGKLVVGRRGYESRFEWAKV